MCDECTRLHNTHRETAERLLAAQRDLARHGANRNGEFDGLWRECEAALKTLWRLRQEMEHHVCTLGGASLSVHAD